MSLRVVVVLSLALAACQKRPAGPSVNIEQIERENRELKAEIVRQKLIKVEPAPAPEPPALRRPDRPEPAPASAPRFDDWAVVRQFRSNLADANSSIAELRERLDTLENKVAALTAENQQLTASLVDSADKLAVAGRSIESAQREARTANDRAGRLEAANRKLGDEIGARTQRTADLALAAAELEELDRRRENYIGTILRRYREIGEQYRSAAGSQDSRRPIDAAPNRIIDLAYVHEAISMAEDDLRQLHALNIQAGRAKKKLANSAILR